LSDSAASMRNKPAPSSGGRGRLRSPQDLAAGLFMLAISAFAFWQSDELTVGTLRSFGPGMMPQLLSGLCAICGLAMLIGAFVTPGPALERWTLRGPVFVLGAAVAFGLTIRPLGLVVAAPLALVLSSYASTETKLKETLIFGIGMTVFCIVLFKVLLGLPVPVAPWAGF
jgi:putative tricarboxylic transport membrane protein